MYVEEKAAGEVQVLKPSQAIRIGHKLVPENNWCFEHCALGAMWLGYGREQPELTQLLRNEARRYLTDRGVAEAVGRALGLKEGLGEFISNLHSRGVPRLKIAEYLAEIGN